MVRQAVIFTENGIVVNDYSVVKKPSATKRFVSALLKKPLPEYPLLCVKDEEPLSMKEQRWKITKVRADRGERILLKQEGGTFWPVTIELEKKKDQEGEQLSSDDLREFENEVVETSQLTQTKWRRIQKLVLIALFVIFAIGISVIAIVLVTKAGTEQLGVIKGGVDQGINNFLNSTTQKILGG